MGESAPLRAEDGQVRGGAVATTVEVVRIPPSELGQICSVDAKGKMN
jgi:hypothetical protein